LELFIAYSSFESSVYLIELLAVGYRVPSEREHPY